MQVLHEIMYKRHLKLICYDTVNMMHQDFVTYAIVLIATPAMLTGNSFMQASELYNKLKKPSWKHRMLMLALLVQIEKVPEIRGLRVAASTSIVPHTCEYNSNTQTTTRASSR